MLTFWPKLPPWVGRTLTAAGLVFLWASLLWLPRVASITFFDNSWQESLNYFTVHHLQAGRDFVFTYGPLGYLSTGAFHPATFGLAIVWEIVVKSILVFLLVASLKNVRWSMKAVVFATAFLLLPHSYDAQYILILLLVGLKLLKTQNLWLILSGTSLLAVLSLVKFTFAWLSGAILLIVVLDRLCRRNWFPASTVAVAFPCLILLIWLLAGQSINNLPAYITTSVEFLRFYSEFMSAKPALASDLIGFVPIIFVVIDLILILRLADLKKQLSRVAILAVVVATLWKAGFVRADSHMFVYFALMPIIVIVGLTFAKINRMRFFLALSSIILCFIGALAPFSGEMTKTKSNFRTLIRPGQARQQLEKKYSEALSLERLPKLSKIIGTDSVDVISYGQRAVMANEWNWTPRPVFQSYAAGSPRLQQLNADFFNSPKAPTYILYQLETIDDRLPTLDDGLSMRSLLSWYNPIGSEDTYQLLKRREVPRQVIESSSQRIQAKLGDQIPVANSDTKYVFAKVKVELSVIGRIEALLTRSQRLEIAVTIDNTVTHYYRFVPSMGTSEFLLSPLPEEAAEIPSLINNTLDRRITSFAIVNNNLSTHAYRAAIDVELTSFALAD